MPCFKTLSCVKKRKPSLGIISQHEFEIGNAVSSKKWISKGARLHDNVTVKIDGDSEPWIVEREDDTPFWSFHILSKKKKLYLSYDDNSNDISLELEDTVGKKRLFEVLLENNMVLALREPPEVKTERPARYIQYTPTKDNEEVGKLEMVAFTEEQLPENMQWLIKEDLEALEAQEQHYNVEIQHTSQKWISSNAHCDQPVPVGQSGEMEKWRMVSLPKPSVMLFSVSTEPPLFASCEQRQNSIESDKVMFYAGVDSEIRKYEPKWDGLTCKFKNMSSCDWVGISNDPDADSQTLELKKDEIGAAAWNVVVTSLPYGGEQFLLFPP